MTDFYFIYVYVIDINVDKYKRNPLNYNVNLCHLFLQFLLIAIDVRKKNTENMLRV